MRALISVSDKREIEYFAQGLIKLGFEIVSTGGSFEALKNASIKATSVSDLTGFEEILDGRVKTLHPNIFGGILHKRDDKTHTKTLKEKNIKSIDLVCVNLYPFEGVIKTTNNFEEIIENIDIGGVSLIRAGAKNFKDCIVITEPRDYQSVLETLTNNKNNIDFRKKLMQKAFAHTSRYDSIISNYMADGEFKDIFTLSGKKVFDTRYGENPHQKASLYAFSDFFDNFNTIKGDISFNNLLDINACIKVSAHFNDTKNICIVKHGNPCGFAINDDDLTCLKNALICDPISAYGGVAGVSCEISESLALSLSKVFLEVIIAPSFSKEAKEILSKKKRIKLVELKHNTNSLPNTVNKIDVKMIEGGFLVQEKDEIKKDEIKKSDLKSKNSANNNEMQDLEIAYKIASCTKSNSIVYVKNQILVAIGMGMTSRIDAAKSAILKAKDQKINLDGCVMASEAFFPFRDSIDEASKVGVRCIIQPGGSIRDDEVIASANENNIALYFTGTRHFLH